jgi:hypothetical protein
MPRKGTHPTEEHLRNLSLSHMGHIHTEEHKRKIGEALKGRTKNKGRVPSQEERMKISIANKGKVRSEATRKKMSEVKMGNKSRLGIPHTEASKQKLRISNGGNRCWNWQGGISFLPYCIKFNKEFKERVRKFFDYKCVFCGKTQMDNRKSLSVHHVNFDKMSCCDDTKPLFVTLCASCHSQTNTKREYWEQYFTGMITTKYDGKCYLEKGVC